MGQSQSPDSGTLDEKEIPILDNSGRSRDARNKESTGEVWNYPPGPSCSKAG